MKITQWDGVNSAKRQSLSAKIRMAEEELEQAENLLLDIEHKLAALYEEYDAIPEFNGFTTVETQDAAQ
jgi:hypothetical protein